MKQQGPLLLCSLNSTQMCPYKYCSYSLFQGIFRVWKGIFGIRDLPKIRCRNRERDKYIDRIRDLTVPREARLVKNCAQDADFVSRECRKPSRPTGSSGQSKLTRRALSGVCFQTKHPMGCLVNRS